MASATGSTIYVNNATTANCSDSAADAGTQAQPYCTVQAAVNAAQPGDTVQVAHGIYGPVDVKNSGTAAAPITITGPAATNLSFPNLQIPNGGSGPSLTFDHVHNVVVTRITVQAVAPTAVGLLRTLTHRSTPDVTKARTADPVRALVVSPRSAIGALYELIGD